MLDRVQKQISPLQSHADMWFPQEAGRQLLTEQSEGNSAGRNMHWTVQVAVVLLNMGWIAFFSHPDPLTVFRQRRHSDRSGEVIISGQFCVAPQSELIWTSTVRSDTITSRPLQDNDKKPTVRSDTVTSTDAKDTNTLCAVCAERNSDGAGKKINSDNHNTGRRPTVGSAPDGCCFRLYPKRLNKNFVREYHLTNDRCMRRAVILTTEKSRHFCVEPSQTWVKNIMKSLDAHSDTITSTNAKDTNTLCAVCAERNSDGAGKKINSDNHNTGRRPTDRKVQMTAASNSTRED